ncbi:outer membrane protein assembly factor BamD [Elioraea sp.]|jgi:outer membrane protein assembly factor BamD|uniref:outer membrane protein assembly factor BamD n=1 Tax=Elioraea sp. TaxID=2185103 RepID=UPI0021DE9126|nr:outer membrane protein assembly factor BamD [Elioraea sp.]GIX10412.1 MAG: outer membrane protein assembly factor BamD [Elioraea sp.]
MPRRHPLAALLLVLLLAAACGSGREGAEEALITRDRPVEAIYNDAADALEAREYGRAVRLFDEVERQHPYSSWAVNAKLMAAYAEYMRNNYTEAIAALDRFIRLHPANPNIAYAYYLRALSYYEQIADVERDQRLTQQALAALTEVVNRFPDTPYGRDARLKIDLARDHLAGKEMVIGRWYQRRNLYLAALNRFRRVVEEFQTTNHVAEALHRMTECYLALGLTEEARRTAAVLGHNFPGSPWYQDSYALLVPGAEPAERDRPGWLSRWWAAIF